MLIDSVITPIVGSTDGT